MINDVQNVEGRDIYKIDLKYHVKNIYVLVQKMSYKHEQEDMKIKLTKIGLQEGVQIKTTNSTITKCSDVNSRRHTDK